MSQPMPGKRGRISSGSMACANLRLAVGRGMASAEIDAATKTKLGVCTTERARRVTPVTVLTCLVLVC